MKKNYVDVQQNNEAKIIRKEIETYALNVIYVTMVEINDVLIFLKY